MADIADPDFLASLKALLPYPDDALESSERSSPSLWIFIVAVAFSSANVPEAVPEVFKYAVEEISQVLRLRFGLPEDEIREHQLSIARKSINSLVALHEAMPEYLREQRPLRDTAKPPAEWDKRGEEVFRAVYRDSADGVQKMLNDAYPDLGWFCTTVGYGMTYGGTSELCIPRELVYVQLAALIATDAPRQVAWHLKNARALGAPHWEVRAVRAIAVQVAKRAGVVWRTPVPDLLE